jgi:hypothetical protein
VPTSDNFGAQGQPPTHPELLEWLSSEFVRGGWRVKPLVKQMMLSSVYRQASRRDTSADGSDPEAVDPGNLLWWRMPLRRLESEVVRDSILSASGQLNPAMGGPPVPIAAQSDGTVMVARQLPHPGDAGRRSVYLLSRRAYNLSLLTVFDQPLVATNCLARDASAVPLQSLTMLNSAFVTEQAEQFARRIEQSDAAGPDDRIERAFRGALARLPNADERATCRALLDRQAHLTIAAGATAEVAAHRALVQVCHVLFNTSEFLYAE